MGSFLPNSRQEQQRMLKETGYENFDALFSQIPEAVRVKELHLPGGMSELEASAWMEETGRKNKISSALHRMPQTVIRAKATPKPRRARRRLPAPQFWGTPAGHF